MKKLTKAEITKVFPALKSWKPDGKSDFNHVADVIDSRNPKMVWAIINAFDKSAEPSRHSAKLEKLFSD